MESDGLLTHPPPLPPRLMVMRQRVRLLFVLPYPSSFLCRVEKQLNVSDEDVVIFTGDFNCNIRGIPDAASRTTLLGKCKSSNGKEVKKFQTGYKEIDGKGVFAWSDIVLKDAFEGINSR